MSFYATITGEITYPNPASFAKMVEELQSGGWVDKNGCFVDECGDKFSETPNIHPNALVIDIPLAHHRNLSRVNFFPEGAKGYVVGTSTDGCFEGWVIEDGEEKSYDLEEWAKENMDGEDKVGPDPDDDFDLYVEWQSLVEEAFFDENT